MCLVQAVAVANTVAASPSQSVAVMEGEESVDPVLCGWLNNTEALANLDHLFGHLQESQCAELIELINS